MTATPEAVLTELHRLRVQVQPLPGDRLRVEGPAGAVTPELRRALVEHKEGIRRLLVDPPVPRAMSAEVTRLLNLSFDEFAREHVALECRVPTCTMTIFFAPTEWDAGLLMRRGIGRGRIWTARELERFWDAGIREQDQAQTLARIKAHLGCELEAIELFKDLSAPPLAGGAA